MREISVRLQDLDVCCREAGPAGAPQMLFLHGWPESGDAFDLVMAELASDYGATAYSYSKFAHDKLVKYGPPRA